MRVVKDVYDVKEFKALLEEYDVPESVVERKCQTFNRYINELNAELPAKVVLEKELKDEITIIPWLLKKKIYNWDLEVSFKDGHQFSWARI